MLDAKTRPTPEIAESESFTEFRLMSLSANLKEMERAREAYWLRYPSSSPFRLRPRAQTVRHGLHVLPGDNLLEIGAGSGLWTEHLSKTLNGENPITAAVFNEDLARSGSVKNIPNTQFIPSAR
jgi:hypothetical protein